MSASLVQGTSSGNHDAMKAHVRPLGDVLLSRDPAVQVPSALEGLTVVFGMGTRGSPPPSSPNGLSMQLKVIPGVPAK